VNEAADDTSSESFYLQTMLGALALVAETAPGRAEWARRIADGLTTVPGALLTAKQAFEKDARAVAAFLDATGWHIVTGAGASWTEAHYFGMCILEEMQWILTRPVHASDFFHGTLELVDDQVSVLLLKDESPQRAVADRVESFVSERTPKLSVVDTLAVELPGVADEVRTEIGHVVLAALLERVAAHLAVLRDHPLTTRRYYRRVEY
jgi:fructoselysine-6-phosphate deglycase